jgi:hypothetical protein
MARPKKEEGLAAKLASLSELSRADLCDLWRKLYERPSPPNMSQSLLIGSIAYKLQEKVYGGLPASLRKFLQETANDTKPQMPAKELKPGAVLIREWQGITHEVTVLDKGYLYRGKQHRSLTAIARLISGMHRSGPEFFGLRSNAN